MATSPIVLTPGLLRAMRVSGWTLLVTLVVAVLDAGLGVRLPQPLRSGVPWVLVGSLLVWLTLLSGTLGMPKKPGDSGDTLDASPRAEQP